ncbi:uncharacterized protein LOC143146431 isoform X4 [Ptiloglossa arizonensis]
MKILNLSNVVEGNQKSVLSTDVSVEQVFLSPSFPSRCTEVASTYQGNSSTPTNTQANR